MPAGVYKPRPVKGIVGYPTTKHHPYPPLRFVGKDHSQRPATSTKRLGRRRGPGGGGRGGELRRLAEAITELQR